MFLIVDSIVPFNGNKQYREANCHVIIRIPTVCPGSSDPPEKYLIYLHQKMRFTPFTNYYDILG